MTLSTRYGLIISSIFWLAITAFGIYFLVDIKKYINFGIDLVGGTYLTLDVKIEEAVKNELLGEVDNLIDELKKRNLEAPTTKIDEVAGIASLEFKSEKDAKVAQDLMSETFSMRKTRAEEPNVSVLVEKNVLKLSLSPLRLKQLKRETVDANISILRSRLDVFGAGEITIVPKGDRRIVIELPNVSDPEKAKSRIGKAALLELKPVYDQAHSKEKLLEKLGGTVPEGTMIVEAKAPDGRAYLVPNYSKVTGRSLKDAFYSFRQPDFFQGGRSSPHLINFAFNPEGTKKFFEMTRDHQGGQIAIIIDNIVITAPGVDKPIDSGAFIQGPDITEEYAKEMVALLKSGAFSAPVEIIEERHIGPALGQESINKGLMSCAIGMGLLFLFSILTYKVAGIFAFIVLIYNLLLILFGLALIPDATLTLPGIAGMVLTVGMAIDASILIYERIKEELASGVTLRNAIYSGFQGATSVILDANITTFIVGAVLYYLGSPAIQGFALAIMIGIVSTLITGLLLLRWFFNFSFDILGVKKISI